MEVHASPVQPLVSGRVWERMFESLTKGRDNLSLTINSTIARLHRQAAPGKRGARDQAPGRSRGGLTPKIHMLADALGRPSRLLVTPRQAGDVAAAPAPLDGQEDGAVLADKVYDSKALRELIVAAIGAEAVTSSN